MKTKQTFLYNKGTSARISIFIHIRKFICLFRININRVLKYVKSLELSKRPYLESFQIAIFRDDPLHVKRLALHVKRLKGLMLNTRGLMLNIN